MTFWQSDLDRLTLARHCTCQDDTRQCSETAVTALRRFVRLIFSRHRRAMTPERLFEKYMARSFGD